MCFIEFIGSTLILCLLGYYVITVRNDALYLLILYLFSDLSNKLIYFRDGNETMHYLLRHMP